MRFVRNKSLKAFKDKIRARTIRSRGDSLARILADLNPLLRGWFEYFKHARPRLFKGLDGFIRRRLRAILRKQEKRPSKGRSEADHTRWTNAFFADEGLFTLQVAHEAARHSRCGQQQLESRVRENRKHGSEGGEASAFPTPIGNQHYRSISMAVGI